MNFGTTNYANDGVSIVVADDRNLSRTHHHSVPNREVLLYLVFPFPLSNDRSDCQRTISLTMSADGGKGSHRVGNGDGSRSE